MMVMNGMIILDQDEVGIIEGFASEEIPTRELIAFARWLEFKSQEISAAAMMGGVDATPAVQRMAADMLVEWRNMLPLEPFSLA